MILHLKYLNKFVLIAHFKLEDHRTVQKLLTKNCFLATIDLKDAYMLLPVAASHRKYLRFMVNNVLFEFTCLPFGLCTAPFAFTKFIKPLVAFLKNRGFLSVPYLDDFLLIGKSYNACLENLHVTCSLLKDLVFLINFKKSSLEPSQTCRYLGFIYNSQTFNNFHPRRQKS